MQTPSRYNYNVVGFDVLMLAADLGSALAAREDKDLIYCVHFLADVATNGHFHRHKLAVEAGVKDAAEVTRGADVGC